MRPGRTNNMKFDVQNMTITRVFKLTTILFGMSVVTTGCDSLNDDSGVVIQSLADTELTQSGDDASGGNSSDNANPGDDGSNSGNVNGGTNGNVDEGSNPIRTVSFRSIQSEIFNPSCSGCHNGFFGLGGLDLGSANNSYANLVGIGSTGKDGATRVIAGLPDESYLIQKLEASPGIVGDRMPQGIDPLSVADVQRIRDWIAGGALDN